LNADLLQGFYLGDFFVEPLKGGVTGRSRSRHLPPKAVEVLLCLATTPGQLVTRETLIESVWGRGHGSHEALSHAVTEIRHALEDDTADPRFIQTLPTRGYRLVVDPVASSQFTGSVVIGADNAASIADLGIFESLQRRGVIETGVAYLVFGWLLIQIADIVFAQLHLPTWAGTFVTALVIAGFPIAIVLSWFLEFRDGKAVFDAPSPDAIQRRRFGRTYLSVIGGLAAAGVLVFAYDQYIGLPEAKPTVATMATAEITVADNSIAVLWMTCSLASHEFRDCTFLHAATRRHFIPTRHLRKFGHACGWRCTWKAASRFVATKYGSSFSSSIRRRATTYWRGPLIGQRPTFSIFATRLPN
jgi:DNA-binding winged helix-turn-helix (wHTH) protein